MEPDDPIYTALLTYTKALSVALGYRDLLTRLHSERVLGLAGEIGVGCGLSRKELGILKIAASLHDIGKIGIPDQILLKPSRLDPAEWEKMKQHAEIGERIMGATEVDGAHHVSQVIRHHHEYYDGQGYPDRLAGEDISVYSRIIAIADSYDAIATARSYRRATPHPEIMAILQAQSGQKYDPAIMRIFCEIIETSEFNVARI